MKEFINIALCLDNVLLLISSIILEYLSKTKMGVHRYVIAKNSKIDMYLDINLLRIIFILSIIISVLMYIHTNMKNKKVILIVTGIISILGTFMSFNNFKLEGYYFILLAILISIVINYIKILFIEFKNKY